MVNFLVIVCFIPFTSTTFDRHFPLASSSMPASDRRTINLVIWPGPYAAEASLPALLTVMDRVKNKSLLPDYVNVRMHIAVACRAAPPVTPTTEYIGITQFFEGQQHFDNLFDEPVHGIVGPFDTNCLFHLAQLLGHYNIPVMPHSCVGSVLATDRDRFPTLSRVAFTSEALGRGVHHLVEHFGWKQVAVLGGALGIQTYLESHDIQVNYYGEFNDTSGTDVIDAMLEETKRRARIVIVPSTSLFKPVETTC